MADTTRFGVEIDSEILGKFLDKINEKYHKGKIRETIEGFMKKYSEGKE